MSDLRFPYTDLHTLNLDWIIDQLNKEGTVLSVNDKHGVVVLTGEDIKRNTTTPETVAQALSSQGSSIQAVRIQIGTTPIPTVAQSLTGAIAENAGEIADIQDNVIGSTALPTTAQTLTGAIAENAGEIADIDDTIGSTALPTTAQTITGAIEEHESDISTLNGYFSSITFDNATTLTLSNCTPYNDIGVRLWKRGRIVIVAMNVQGLTANNRTQIATLPEGYRPLIDAVFFGGGGLSYSNKTIITARPTGELYVLPDDTYSNGYFMFYAP